MIQKIHGTRVVNLSWFGKHLQALLERNEAAEIIAGYGTFQAGGCYVLARVLTQMREGLSLWVVIRSDGVTDHVVAGNGVLFLDADGLATSDDLIQKYRQIELVEAVAVRPIAEVQLHPEIRTDDATEQRLLEWLRPRLRIKWFKPNSVLEGF
jgi:hypothetical protein